MRLRQNESEQPVVPIAERADGGENPETVRAQGAALLAAADEAITRALSQNSSEFLAQNRQAGGE
jgi:hypothetical protein